jgi:hypothetical protein
MRLLTVFQKVEKSSEVEALLERVALGLSAFLAISLRNGKPRRPAVRGSGIA